MFSHSLKLEPRSDLLLSIRKYSNENHIYGFVNGVVGNLSKVTIQCPNNKSVREYEGNLEIISLNGSFNYGDAHLHLSFSNEDCDVFGGHLEEGCVVKKGAEILLLSIEKEIKDISFNNFSDDARRVKVYILNNCPWSKRALRLLNSSDINYDVEIIKNDEDFKIVNKISKHETFPQIFVDGSFFGGYDELSDLYRKNSLNSFK